MAPMKYDPYKILNKADSFKEKANQFLLEKHFDKSIEEFQKSNQLVSNLLEELTDVNNSFSKSIRKEDLIKLKKQAYKLLANNSDSLRNIYKEIDDSNSCKTAILDSDRYYSKYVDDSSTNYNYAKSLMESISILKDLNSLEGQHKLLENALVAYVAYLAEVPELNPRIPIEISYILNEYKNLILKDPSLIKKAVELLVDSSEKTDVYPEVLTFLLFYQFAHDLLYHIATNYPEFVPQNEELMLKALLYITKCSEYFDARTDPDKGKIKRCLPIFSFYNDKFKKKESIVKLKDLNFDLALIRFDIDDLENTVLPLMNVIELNEINPGMLDSYSEIITLEGLNYFLGSLGKPDEAQNYHSRLVSLLDSITYKDLMGKEHNLSKREAKNTLEFNRAKAYYNMAISQRHAGNDQQAIEYMEKAKDYLDKVDAEAVSEPIHILKAMIAKFFLKYLIN